MKPNKSLDQHIAVFGESGSGKTVLLSSFYGPTQEPEFAQGSLYRVIADSIGQHRRLNGNYLGMRDSARAPAGDKLSSTSYAFTIKMRENMNVGAKKKPAPYDSLRLVWHDYPGEWFEQDVSGAAEEQRRVDTFRSLLASDVALILVDAQRLIEYEGEEERYLKALFGNFRHSLETLKPQILSEGEPLTEFPRIWIVALSKSDLLPELDVYGFRNLIESKAGDDLDQLTRVIGEMIQGKEALSVGEDFLLLSSAEFTPDRIVLTKRVGVDLILPIAAVLPVERHIRWVKSKDLPNKVKASLLEGARSLADLALWAISAAMAKAPAPVASVLSVVRTVLSKDVLDEVVKLAGEKLNAANDEALAKHQYLIAMLLQFRMLLETGEEERAFLRSQR